MTVNKRYLKAAALLLPALYAGGKGVISLFSPAGNWSTAMDGIASHFPFLFGSLLFIYAWSAAIEKEDNEPTKISVVLKDAFIWILEIIIFWTIVSCAFFLGFANYDALSMLLHDLSWELPLAPRIDLAFDCVMLLGLEYLLLNYVRGTEHRDKTSITLFFIIAGIVGSLANYGGQARSLVNFIVIIFLYVPLTAYILHKNLTMLNLIQAPIEWVKEQIEKRYPGNVN